ncbi:MAG: exodeoxyribonuclease VII small subunit [Lachnospiraceae bacterium]
MAGKKKEEATLEEVFSQLDDVMKELQEEDVSLENSFELYHKGMDLLKQCNRKIETVEKKMLVLDAEGEEHEF